MKFTLNWLKEHLDTSSSLEEISRTLTAIGLEVEDIDDPSKSLAPFVIAEVKEAEKHPDADRLKVCKVYDGANTVQVVCGAPNAKAGMKGVFAAPGSYVPGTDITLKKGNIRGVDSEGMLLSERELGLSDEHEGIIELAGDAPVGEKYADYAGLNDPVLEIALTPNRADCACVRGIARDLAAAGLGSLKPLEVPTIDKSFKSPVDVKMQFDTKEDQAACPIFLGRAIKGVKNGPSPAWLQQRLKAVGLRPISALVDITNYFTLTLNRPLHVFDMDRLSGDIHVRFSKDSETLEALNDKTYTLKDGMIAICDDSGVVGLGGIVGGVPTAVENETTNVFLEVALFDPMRVARTGRDLGISSDARYRFERGIDPDFIFDGAQIATKMILDLCGGEASEIVQAGEVPETVAPVIYDPARVEKLTGLAVSSDRQREILESLGFIIDKKNAQEWSEQWIVNPPSWRPDIFGPADLVEEVVRIIGYDSIPVTPVKKEEDSHTKSCETRNIQLARLCRTTLAARGFQEAVTWSFMSRHLAGLFGANDNQEVEQLRLLNPISNDLDQMRPTPLGNLIEAAVRNADKGFPDSALFEVGPAFESAKPEGEILVTAAIRSGRTNPRHWAGPETNRQVDLYDAKADLLAALEACGFDGSKAPISRDAPAYFHPGQSGTLRLGPNILGHFGMIHPAILEEMDADFPIAAFELYPEKIPAPKNKGNSKGRLDLSDLQPVRRDFAFLVDRDLGADQLIRAAMGADKNLIKNVSVFDVYTGKGVEESKKSVALEVTLQPQEKTLTEKDIEEVSNKLVQMVESKTGGKLRA